MSVTITSYVPAHAGGTVTSGILTLNAPNQGVQGQLATLFMNPGEIIIGTGTNTFSMEDFGDVLDGTFSPGYSYNDLLIPSATLDVNSQLISNLLDPVGLQDGATKNYVDIAVGTIGGPFLALAGGTMTGDIILDTTSTARVQLSDGTMASPSLTFENDTDTGLWWPAMNSIGMVTSGTTKLTIDSTGTLTVPSGYESLVIADTVIPNRKYVDDEIALAIGVAGPFLQLSGGIMFGSIAQSLGGVYLGEGTGNPLLPDYAFVPALDTGMYYVATDGIGFANTGVNTFTIESTGTLRVPVGYEALVVADTVITNKKYVDDQDALYLPLAGGTMAGAIDMGGFLLSNILAPTAAGDVTDKNYVDTEIGSLSSVYLPLAGGTMSGNINMATNTIAFDADLDTNITSTVDDVLTISVGAATATIWDGITSTISFEGYRGTNIVDPTGAQDVSTKNYVDTTSLPFSGGTMTGAINMGGSALVLDVDLDTSISAAVDDTVVLAVGGSAATIWDGVGTTISFESNRGINFADPTGAQDAATKNYVDTTFLPLSGGTMTGAITFDAAQLFPYDNTASGMTATDLQAATDELDGRMDSIETSGPFLSLSGGTMSGAISMGSNDITNGGSITGTTLNTAGAAISATDMQSALGGRGFLTRSESSPTASIPTYSFVTNSDSGIYTTGSDVRVSIGGSDRLRLGTDVDVQGAKVTNVADPVSNGDAVNLGFLAGISFVRVLGTASGVDFNTTGATTIYTVPVGKTHIITQVVIRATSVVPGGAPTNPDVSVGTTAPNYDQIVDDNTTLNWSGAATAADQAVILSPKDGSATPNAADVVSLEVDTASGFTTLEGTVYVVGFEV